MTIAYDDIFSKCQMLSSFEGGRLTDAQGESLYPVVHITDQDKPLIKHLTGQAMTAVHAAARYAFEDVSQGDEISIALLAGNAKVSSSDAQKTLEECLAMYVMQYWLENKEPERSKAYGTMFENMLGAFTRLAYRKHAPSLNDYE